MSSSKKQNDWRYRCPEGHCTWNPRADGTYYCRQCNEKDGRTGHFDELRDMQEEPLRY